jgi:hypothetical protein
VTKREDEAREKWHVMDQKTQEEYNNGSSESWGFEGEGLIQGAQKLIKV